MTERALGAADWRGFGREQFPQESWSVDGDVLHAIAQAERIHLVSRERFADFILSFDWRLPRGGSTAVLCRVQEEAGAPERSGPALQLLDDEHHAEGADALTSCGALYGLMAPWHDLRSSANAYHSARILMRGSAIEYWIDETQVIGCDLASEELRARIARSRFRDLPQFARSAAGNIVLQHRGTDAWFRRLRIEVTPA